MKVVMAAPYYPPHIGGIEVHVKNLARGMKQRGYKVEVITSIGKDGEVDVRTIPSIRIPYSPIPIAFPRVSGDIYHSHIPSPFFARGLMKRKCKPHIVTYHNDVVVPKKVDGKSVPGFIARWIERKNEELIKPILDDAEVIISTAKSYAKTSPVLDAYMDKVAIIPNGVNANAFLPGRDAGEREEIVLYVGRLVDYKGLSVLLKAMKIVQSKANGRIIIVGEGEDRKRFEELAIKMEVRAEFKGRLPDESVRKWIQKARVLVLPSQSRLEAFGIVLLEAMACKTPVIASKIPGVMDVASEGGLTFEGEDELAQKIVKLLINKSFATKIGRRGRRAVEKRYDWKVVLDELERVYRDCT